jgi:Tol biopolymer transport system component
MLKRWRALGTLIVTIVVAVLCSVSHKSSGQNQQGQLEPMLIGRLYWASPDDIFFFGNPESQSFGDTCGYYRLRISTGSVQKVMDINDVRKYLFGPLSPDGSLIAYSYGDETTSPEQVGFYVMNPDGTNSRRFYPTAGNLAWLPDSKTIAYLEDRAIELNGRLLSDPREFLVFVDIESGREIDAIQIDQRPHCDSEVNPEREESECSKRCNAGLPCILSEDISRPGGTGTFYFFPDGQHILYIDEDQNGLSNFFVFDLATLSSEQVSFFDGGYGVLAEEFELAPDGTAVAFSYPYLQVLNLQNGTLWGLEEPLVPNEPEAMHEGFSWSRDSRWIAFVRSTVFSPDIPEDKPWEETVREVPNQIWIVSRDGQQVRLIADLWVDNSGKIVNLAANWPSEKRYYANRVKVKKLAWRFPSSLRAAWHKPTEKRNLWLALLIGIGLSILVLVGFATWRYRHHHSCA